MTPPLAHSIVRTHYACMGIKEDAVRAALDSFTGSTRALAREVGITEGHLRAIRDGRRVATLSVVEKTADAMEATAERHAKAARILRASLQGEEDS